MLTLPGERLDWDSRTWGRSGVLLVPLRGGRPFQDAPRPWAACKELQSCYWSKESMRRRASCSGRQQPGRLGVRGEGGAGFWRCWPGDAALQVSPGGRELQV